MKKPLRQPPSQSTRANPKGVVDIVPRPFSFCKGSGSPCLITPPELEMLPHAGPCGDHPGARGRGAPLSQRIARFLYTTPLAGPRCTFLGLRRVGGYRGNEIFFVCRVLCASGSPYSANESFFLSTFFDVLGAARGLSRLDVSSFPSRAGRGAFPGPPQAFARVYA